MIIAMICGALNKYQGYQIKICSKTNPVIELGQQIESYNPKSIEKWLQSILNIE